MTDTEDKTGTGERGVSAAPALRPKDAATVILVDETGSAPRILMGRRRADLVFLPGMFVFPGGGVDARDAAVPSANELAPAELARLLQDMKGHPSEARARALAMAAVREAFEEAGLVIGKPAHGSIPPLPPAGNERTDTWAGFFATGQVPNLAALSLFARAITPPGRPRRYDTRFFTASADAVSLNTNVIDDELSEIDWFLVDEARALDLPRITRAIIDDLDERLRLPASERFAAPVPFYFFRAGTFCRELIGRASEA